MTISLAEVLIAAYIIFTGIKNKKFIVSILQLFKPLWFFGLNLHKNTVSMFIRTLYSTGFPLLWSSLWDVSEALYWYTLSDIWNGITYTTKDTKKERVSFFCNFSLSLCNVRINFQQQPDLDVFCWELTTLCSYLLIGYTRTPEAVNNSFHALAINLGGGLAFASAMVYIGTNFKTLELSALTAMKLELAVLIPVFLLCIAALTKSAQMPFSSWLLGQW